MYLPPYSPDLNPIEQIWRAIKREVAATFIMNYEHLTTVIARAFEILTAKRSYWEKWVIKFLSPKYASKMLSDELYSQVLQDDSKRVDLASKAFFRRVKAGGESRYPRFKGKGRYDSITYPQSGFHLNDACRYAPLRIKD